jgi:hypothetical protein
MDEIGIDSGPFGMLLECLQQIGAQANEELRAAGRSIQPSKELLPPGFGGLMKGMGEQR